MALDGFNAALLIENTHASPLVLPSEADGGPGLSGGELASGMESAGALDDVLRATAQPEAGGASHRLGVFERYDVLDPDLWFSSGATRTRHSEPDDAGPMTPLRDLSHHEKLLVAGSNATVDGDPWNYWDPWEWPGGPPNDPGDQYPDGSGGGGGEETPEAQPTPCVEASPEGVSLQAMNNAALAASNAIAARDDENIEYSSIIWSLNGTVGYTTPFTSGSDRAANWLGGLSQVPSGAVIVGIVHNHPDDPYVNDTYPSGAAHQDGDDWYRYDQMVNGTINHGEPLDRGITVDGNLLLYIYSNQDHKTHVYDKTDKSQTTPSCSLQG